MGSSRFAQLIRWLQVVRLAIAVGLATLFLMVPLYGLRGVTSVHADPGILHVDGVSGSDTTDCTDPANACATIGYALSQAGDGDTILVAGGTYTENLVITKTVTLEGGYEPVGWSRCLRSCTTTVDGNQSGRVIDIQSTLSETTVIDGFTITNGDGGISTLLSAVAIQNSKIVHNHTTGTRSGGGMLIDHSSVTITNTLIADNTANNHDGAMRIISTVAISGPSSYVNINSSTIANNSASNGRNGIFCSLSWCIVVNSIVWGHEGEDFSGHGYGATYSCIEMGLPGEGNISEDPRFVDPVNGDYHLRPDSPCIDAGYNEDAPETDFERDPRPIGERVDMGFDEWPTLDVTLSTNQASEGPPDTDVTYVFTVTNTGSYTDTMSLAASGVWTPTLGADTTGPLGPGGALTIALEVSIPPGAVEGTSDVMTLTATSGWSAKVSDSTQATTTARWYKVYLPVIFKDFDL